jgi:hypothetical protein
MNDSAGLLADPGEARAILVACAKAGEPISYSEMLGLLGFAFSRPKMRALCKLLGVVDEEAEARGEPELAVLVVRKSDRLPGEGFFHGLWRDGAYDGPATGPAAATFIERETERVFAHWAGRRP